MWSTLALATRGPGRLTRGRRRRRPAAKIAENIPRVAEGSSALRSGLSTIEQTAETLTIRRAGPGAATLTYRLDGTGSRNVLAGADDLEIESLSIVTWDGPRLTIVTKHEAEGKLVEAREVWTVAGNTLTVKTGRAGGGTQKRIYKKR